jgi:hypothetical protein
MRTFALFLPLLAAFVLSGCAADPAMDLPPREVTPTAWATHTVDVSPYPVQPAVDTTFQREPPRRAPLGGGNSVVTMGPRYP